MGLSDFVTSHPENWPAPTTFAGQAVRHEVYKDFVNEAMRDLANWGSSYCLTERELIAVGKMLWAATQMLQDIQQLRDDQLPLRAQLWEAERLSAAFVDRAIAHLDEDRR